MKYIKRTLSILLCLMLLISAFSVFPVSASAVSGLWGENLTWTYENGTFTVSGTGAMYAYEVDGRPYDIEKITDDITSVVISEGVTSVSDEAFEGLENLTSVSLPSTLTSIGEWAFSYCSSLSGITIPASVTSVGSKAFMDCTLLSSVTINENSSGTLDLGGSAFNNCSSLTSIVLPKQVNIISGSCFAKTGLTELTIARKDFDTLYANAFSSLSNVKIYVPYGFNTRLNGSTGSNITVTGDNYTSYFGANNYVLLTGGEKFNIYWMNEDSSEILELDWAVDSGDTPTYDGDIEEGYTLTWTPEISAVTENAFYTAHYDLITYNIFVGGVHVTALNRNDVLGDGGKVKFVPKGTDGSIYNILYLKNAAIEVTTRDDGGNSNAEFGIRTNGVEDLEISLEGDNIIKDTETASGVGEKYGIAVYQKSMDFFGSGTLDISMNADNENISYYGVRSVGGNIEGSVKLNINIPGTAPTKGFYVSNNNTLSLTGGSGLFVSTGSNKNTYSLDTDSSLNPNFRIVTDGCSFEARSDNSAFSSKVNFAKPSNGQLFVNSENEGESASEWDNNTRLSTYKYIRYNFDGYNVKVDNNITNGTVTSDKTSCFGGDTVTLTCDSDEGYYLKDLTVKDSSDNEIETEKSDSGYTFTMPESNVTVSAEFVTKIFSGHSLTLDGTIGINYFLNLTDEDIQNGVTVDFTWTSLNKERTASYTVTADDYIKDLGLYKATCCVAAAEMTCDVTASCTIGEESECDIDTYSVYEYGNYILSEEYAAEESLSNLVKSLLRYGSNAQTQFNSNTDILADCMLTSTDPDSSYYYNPSDDFEIQSQKTEMDETVLTSYGLEYAGASATYLTEMSLRLYYRITDENNFAEFLRNNPDFVYHRNSSRDSDLIYIEQENIAPADFDEVYLFEIAAASCKYSILDYVKGCIDGNVSDNMKALARATYHYNYYADLYFTD